MRHSMVLLSGSIVAGFSPSAFAAGTVSSPTLEQRVEELDLKVRTLERQLEVEQETQAADKAKQTATVSAGPDGFAIKSTDNAFQLKLRGLIQADGRFFFEGENATNNDTWLLRRVRPILEGTVFHIFDFRFTPDFAQGRTVIQDAYVDARFFPWLQLRGGKFKTPFGLERLQSASSIRFVERALPNNLVPNRDIGAELHGELGDGLVAYSLAYLNGVSDGRSSEDFGDVDNNVDKDYAARIFAHPFQNTDIVPLQGLGVGVAVSYVDARGDTSSANATLLPSYRTTGQTIFFSYRGGASGTFADGERLRISPQAYYYYGPFGLLGEYVTVSQAVRRNIGGTTIRRADLDHDAWQIAPSYVLTGEDSTYKGVKPKRPFSVVGGGWGAFEVAARYSELSIDEDTFAGGAGSFADPTTAAQRASAYGFGLNWYANHNIKLALDYETTFFKGGGGGTAAAHKDRGDEDVFFSRLQIAF